MSFEAARVVVLCGLPGSGKSSWLIHQGTAALSSDEIRFLLADDPTDQTIHRAVFAVVRHLLRRRLELNRPVTYIDATNLTPRERSPYIKTAQLYNARAEAIFFDTPLALCRERNRNRGRVVPEDALDLMARRLVPPAREEGFEAITILAPTTVAPLATPALEPSPHSR